jgi:hypothetical protein
MVAKHFIAVPPTDQADNIGINARRLEGNGPKHQRQGNRGWAQESGGGFEFG